MRRCTWHNRDSSINRPVLLFPTLRMAVWELKGKKNLPSAKHLWVWDKLVYWRAGHTLYRRLGCLWGLPAQIWTPIQLIASSHLLMTAFLWVLLPGRGQSQVSTPSSSESLTADAAKFPGGCTLLFYMKNENHREAFLKLSGHRLSVSVQGFTP